MLLKQEILFREVILWKQDLFKIKNVKKIYGGEKDGSKDQIKKNGTKEGSFL